VRSIPCTHIPLTLALRHADKPYSTHRVLLGTHTSGQARDYLQIASVQIPLRAGGGSSDVLDRSAYDDARGELGGHAPARCVQVVQRINHAGEVNRARYMPQNADLLATKAVSGEVLVFDRTKHPDEPERDGVCRPDIRLVGQTQEGCAELHFDRAEIDSAVGTASRGTRKKRGTSCRHRTT
jgi:histone-binding protein RBBP4